MEDKKSSPPYSLSLASSLFALVLIIGLMYVTQSVLVPLLFSIIISITLFPIANFLERRLRFVRSLAAIVSVIIAILIIGGILWFIVHESIIIGRDASDITNKVTSVVESFQDWMQHRFGMERSEMAAKFQEQSNKVLDNVGGYLSTAFGSIGSTLAGVVLVPIFIFFLLYYRDFFKEFFFKTFKDTENKKINDVLNKIYQVVQSYFLGLVTVMGIVAVLNTVGLMILGIEYAWFFGSLASFLMLLPYIGIAIGSILPALFALATKDNAWYAIGVIAWFQVVQFLEGNIITPNIVGGKVSINPLMAIIAILVGGMIFGLAGLILALPMTAALKVIFDAIPSMQSIGFLIGEPEKQHLKRNSTQELLMKWGIVRPPRRKKKETEDVATAAKEVTTKSNEKEN
ncbi:AI-2E family transporter [Sphingobacterium sp. SYP-B4668]|uniref:AI-2E family transporter n=1 Tax=Sphingobacterium sp. SYP-B4668 TaxID=2996035 RepID=UPI0022DDA56A|nr:AI-2E family transporter [Sphingobacterium sp. SYP-B4668]